MKCKGTKNKLNFLFFANIIFFFFHKSFSNYERKLLIISHMNFFGIFSKFFKTNIHLDKNQAIGQFLWMNS